MAKQQGQVTKIYQLKTLGYADISKELDNVAKKFENIRKSKLSAQGKLSLTQDTAEVQKYSDEIQKLVLEEQALRVETQKLTNEQKAANLQRQAEIADMRQQRAAAQGVAGAYSEILVQQKQLYALLKNTPTGSPVTFQGQTLQFDQAIAKLKQLSAAEQDFRRQFSKDGHLVAEYTSGIVQAFKQMGLGDLIGGQVTKAAQRINELDKDFEQLKQELSSVGVSGQGSLEKIERQLIENRAESILLKQELGRVQTELRGAGDVGNQITNSIAQGFKNIKGQAAQFALQYVGIQALINQGQQGIQTARISSDQSTDLEIQLGGAAKEADNLNASLSKLNTRTTVTGLQEIADIALKAGVTAQNIEEVTKAIDVTKVAFGKDFGSIEQGTETFAKLINIFFTDGQITGDRILKIGNSIRALANETVASVPFITDFSGRMAGLKQIANVSLPDILGLGAGFEEFKQSAETSSTVLVKVIPKLAADTAKYAQIIGITQDQFSQLINTNPAEALLQVSEALVKSGTGIEDISNALADSELGSGRITTIIATLGGKADIFRQRIARAGETIQETGAITDAFDKKNNNLAATFDKIGKKFSDFFAGGGFASALSFASGAILLILGNLPLLLTLVGLLTISWAAQNIALIGLRAQLILYNLGIGANLVLINVLRLANIAYTVTMFLLNGALTVVTRAAALFNITLGKSPIGLILTGVGLLVSAFKAFGGGLSETTKSLKAQNLQLNIARDVAREAAAATSEQRAQAALLSGVVKDLSISEGTRLSALKKLIELDPTFQKSLTDGKINYEQLNKSLSEYNANLIRSAELQAAQARQTREVARLTTLSQDKQDLEFAISTKDFEKLDEETTKLLVKKIKENVGFLGSLPGKNDFVKAARDVVKDLDKSLDDQVKVIDAAQQVYNDKQKAIDDNIAKTAANISTNAPKVKPVEIDIPGLEADIKKLDEEIKAFKGAQNELDKLVEERKKKQEALDRALNKNQKTTRGSRLSGPQKDAQKDIDAERDRLNAVDEKRRTQSEIDEETYLLAIFATNVAALNKKLKLLKGKNAEERKEIAQFNLEKVKLEQEVNEKLFDLHAKELKDQLDIDIKNAQEAAARVKQDPTASETAKAQAALDADQFILSAQINFNAAMDLLEKSRNNLSKKNQQDRERDVRESNDRIRADLRAVLEGEIKDIERAGANLLAEFDKIIAAQQEAILNSNKNPGQKKAALDEIEKQAELGSIVRQIATLKESLPKYKKQLEDKAITEEEYAKHYKAYVKELKDLNDLLNKANENSTNVRSLVTNKLSKLFGFKEGSGEAQLFAETIVQSFNLAKTAMDDFFAHEQDDIKRSQDAQVKKLELEKQLRLDRADSQAEQDSINRQFAAKEEAINRAAFEKNKKLQKEQAKINLAIQLSNLAVVAFAPNPANIATFGIAGAIMYGIQAALALAAYALNVGRINSATFEKGGQVPTTTGGKITGPSHAQGGVKFQYEAQGDELAIINKKSARDNQVRTITGTNKQIASMINQLGGGISFAAGAKLKTFEGGGYLGQALQAPIFTPSSGNTFVNNSASDKKIDELIASNKELADQ